MMRIICYGLVLVTMLRIAVGSAFGQDDTPPPQVLLTNVQIFNGTEDGRTSGSVLVEGNLIKQVGTDLEARDDAIVIDGGGRTLMPGLIDAHWHTMLCGITLPEVLVEFDGYINLVAAKESERTLLRGFTTVRDVGGNVFSVKKAIDEGLYAGPRIYPSGMAISQTSGHADTRGYADVPAEPSAPLNTIARNGHFIVADGVPQVLQRVRESLRLGASQIKIMAGGGTTSQFDPIDSSQYTLDELRAAVEAAESWNTYVGVHAYTPDACRKAIEAGVKVLEHGQMLDEETMQLVKEKDLWLNMQPFTPDAGLESWSDNPVTRAKQEVMTAGTDTAYRLAKQYDVKLAWGTDIITSPESTKNQGKGVAYMERWFTPFEVLKMVTHDNAQLCKLSGPRDPYQQGTLGVIEEGAYADLILVNGNPLDDLELVADPDSNFDLIMKDGRIFKNAIDGQMSHVFFPSPPRVLPDTDADRGIYRFLQGR